MKKTRIFLSIVTVLLLSQSGTFAQDSTKKVSAASVIEKNSQQAEHLQHKKIQQQQLQQHKFEMLDSTKPKKPAAVTKKKKKPHA